LDLKSTFWLILLYCSRVVNLFIEHKTNYVRLNLSVEMIEIVHRAEFVDSIR